MSTLPTFISGESLARMLGLTFEFLEAEAEAGRIPSIKTEHGRAYNRESVERTLLLRSGMVLRELHHPDGDVFCIIAPPNSHTSALCNTMPPPSHHFSLVDDKPGGDS